MCARQLPSLLSVECVAQITKLYILARLKERKCDRGLHPLALPSWNYSDTAEGIFPSVKPIQELDIRIKTSSRIPILERVIVI